MKDWVLVPGPRYSNNMTLNESLNPLAILFFIHKMGLISAFNNSISKSYKNMSEKVLWT